MSAPKLIKDMTSNEYHTTENTFSSSQLKDILDDPEFFHKKYILKSIEREETPAFDVGTYFHTAVLEPHLIEKECAVYRGGKRIGKVWDEFKLQNKGKAIITESEYEKAASMITAVKASKVAERYLTGGSPELSAFVTVYVVGSNIYTITSRGIYTMDIERGWFLTILESIPKNAVKLVLKVRADYLNTNRLFISDLKSTSGNCKNTYKVLSSIRDYKYDLSASLYLDIFTAAHDMEHVFSNFIWIFASKDTGSSKCYIASQELVVVGRAKWCLAVSLLAKYIKSNWKFEDELGEIVPGYLEKEWMHTNYTCHRPTTYILYFNVIRLHHRDYQ